MIVIPVLRAFADHTEIVQLGGTTYRLRFLWNGRANSWFLTVLGAGGDVIIAGLRVRLEWPLARQHVQVKLPVGELLVIDTVASREEPGRDVFGSDAAPLTFVPDDEVAAAAAGTLLA